MKKTFLKIVGAREPASAMAVDDLWVLSTDRRLGGPFFFARSLWHGASSSGMLEVKLLGSARAADARSRWRRCAARTPATRLASWRCCRT